MRPLSQAQRGRLLDLARYPSVAGTYARRLAVELSQILFAEEPGSVVKGPRAVLAVLALPQMEGVLREHYRAMLTPGELVRVARDVLHCVLDGEHLEIDWEVLLERVEVFLRSAATLWWLTGAASVPGPEKRLFSRAERALLVDEAAACNTGQATGAAPAETTVAKTSPSLRRMEDLARERILELLRDG